MQGGRRTSAQSADELGAQHAGQTTIESRAGQRRPPSDCYPRRLHSYSQRHTTPLVQSFTLSYTSQAAPSLTLIAVPANVVFGKGVNLSGVLAKAASHSRTARDPLGKAVRRPDFHPVRHSDDRLTGAYPTIVKPKKQTVYQANAAGVITLPTVTVKVAQRLKLSVRRKGGKVYFKGSLGPKRKGRAILIQKAAGRRWKTIARVKTGTRSTFAKVLALPLARRGYRFRATTRAYPGLLSGKSRTAKLRH